MGVNYPNYYQQSQYINPYQVRPTYMEQQPQYQFSGLKGRPVASFDEAKASMIDFDGSVFYFPDAANKRIYTKQINIDGTATFNVYSLAAPAEPAETPVYVTKDELDAILAEFKASLTPPQPVQTKVAAPKNFNL